MKTHDILRLHTFYRVKVTKSVYDKPIILNVLTYTLLKMRNDFHNVSMYNKHPAIKVCMESVNV